ncbi:cytochrome ubiquinol oxidase subunit I [Paenibacillus sp. CGMCC 1.16610]|uniref:Cytochrome ubiquinol oxidase subunit I n=1 Tax=Paenibacillus anseongense TaxID=2682845 RepID=A0ABW9U3E0_9BACL|nr:MULTISPECIES: cytochrome ubiquinol oxidase subunit I [Paenibacillus]MBA2937096.1 cytochrome ubiquinol oxidase subunit I [Paenibacillus sp. CGMCC 1.16610]MVQ33418.1 cytochrome ubiquinol oxidase subunit I [Paenibacillus anseongense]
MPTYDSVFYSRLLTETTLAFHIIFATIGVGVPVMIMLAELAGIKHKDPYYTLLARRWARGFVITVAIGVVTGTAIGLQLSLLWPTFMQIAGQAIALPLFLETFAFFIEAIFLGIYLYTWERLKPMHHLLLLVPVVIGSSASAFFITTVNAFMNTPQGFSLKDGLITNVQPILAMFNPSMPTKVAHVLSSAYMTSAFILAAIAAYSLLKKKDDVLYAKKALKLTVTAGLVFAVTTALIGDLSAKFLAQNQPEKLAAAEWHFETTANAPLVLGGILTDRNEIKYALKIPYALSILAGGNPGSEVKGLNEIPPDLRPPLYVHYFFDAMVGIGMFVIVVAILHLWYTRKRSVKPYPKWLLAIIVACGPLSMLGIQCGWFYAEVGRQPWILRGYLKVADAATTSQDVDLMLLLFCFLYIVLALTAVKVLSKLFRKSDVADELMALGIFGGRTKK